MKKILLSLFILLPLISFADDDAILRPFFDSLNETKGASSTCVSQSRLVKSPYHSKKTKKPSLNIDMPQFRGGGGGIDDYTASKTSHNTESKK